MLAVRANAPKAAAVKNAIRLDMVTSPDGEMNRLKPAMKPTTMRPNLCGLLRRWPELRRVQGPVSGNKFSLR
jgi:hypothetical protein